MDERRCKLGVKCAMTRIRDIEKQALNDLEAMIDLDRVTLDSESIEALKTLQVAAKILEDSVEAFYDQFLTKAKPPVDPEDGE